jgi:hypothetical protein
MSTPAGRAKTAAARATVRLTFAEAAAQDPDKLARAVAVVEAGLRRGLVDPVVLVDGGDPT